MKGLAGFGANLASNKFVRAAIREEVRGSPGNRTLDTAGCMAQHKSVYGTGIHVFRVGRRVLLTLYSSRTRATAVMCQY